MTTGVNGWKSPPEVAIQMSDASKLTAETGTGPLMTAPGGVDAWRVNVGKSETAHLVLRFLCLLSSLGALSFMVTAEQAATLSIYGFKLPIYAKWSFADSFEYLVGMSAAAAAHSLVQLLFSVWKLVKRSPVALSRSHAWLIFAGDQGRNYFWLRFFIVCFLDIDFSRPGSRNCWHAEDMFFVLMVVKYVLTVNEVFAYAMISAASAASGVTNLNRTGIHHTALPHFCKPLRGFCDHAAVSITLAFLSFCLLAASAVVDVFWLSINC